MADSGQLLGAASGAMTGAKIGTAIMPGVGTVVGGLLGGVAGLFSGKKSSSSAPAYQPLDISKILTESREAAKTNLSNSLQLEQQYLPGTAALRRTNDIALGNLASGNTEGMRARQSILDSLGGNYGTNPLLQESANRILGNLKLGGALGADVQAQAMQAALQKGSAAGISGSGAARGLVARDLGLTSLGLEQQRIAQAQQAGQAMAQLNLQDLATRGGLAMNAANQDISRTSLLAQVIGSREYPNPGLDPGSIASLYVADNNARNQVNVNSSAIANANRNSNLSALLGFGSQVAGGGYDSVLKGVGGLFGNKTPSLYDSVADASNPFG